MQNNSLNTQNIVSIAFLKSIGIIFGMLLFVTGCTDKYYEMYKSPCACLDEKEIQQIQRQVEMQDLQKQHMQSNNEIERKNTH